MVVFFKYFLVVVFVAFIFVIGNWLRFYVLPPPAMRPSKVKMKHVIMIAVIGVIISVIYAICRQWFE